MKMTLVLLSLLAALSATAQSVVGTWKRTNTLITFKDGRQMDAQAVMEKSMPCATRITYEFLASGTQKTIIPSDCQKSLAAMAKLYADTRYSVKGNRIMVLSPDAKLAPDATYTLNLQGNSMIWTLDYDDQPNIPNPSKAKAITLTYKRL